MNDYQKMCDTNKNVIKMGVIIKGVYYMYLRGTIQDNNKKPL
jgi:hypothetical protein